MKLIKSILPHFTIILSGIFIVFLILDRYNPTMNFLSNPVSQKLFWLLCVVSIVNSGVLIRMNRKAWREKRSEEVS